MPPKIMLITIFLMFKFTSQFDAFLLFLLPAFLVLGASLIEAVHNVSTFLLQILGQFLLLLAILFLEALRNLLDVSANFVDLLLGQIDRRSRTPLKARNCVDALAE